MKLHKNTFTLLNNANTKTNLNSNSPLNFKAGLTSQMKKEIKECKPTKISEYLNSKYMIFSDFKGNKTLAWCSLKCMEIIEQLNKKFCLRNPFPLYIGTGNFNIKTPFSQNNVLGISLFDTMNIPIDGKKDSLFGSNSVLFNSLDAQKSNQKFNWDNIDEEADKLKKKKQIGTNFFLDIFMHEFSHIMHYHNRKNVLNIEEQSDFKKQQKNITNHAIFLFKHKKSIIENICKYAATNQYELIACDLSKRICENLDKNNLIPNLNFIDKSPYQKIKKFNSISKNSNIKATSLDKAINKYWNGNFKEFIKDTEIYK